MAGRKVVEGSGRRRWSKGEWSLASTSSDLSKWSKGAATSDLKVFISTSGFLKSFDQLEGLASTSGIDHLSE